ncbi:hypothetical protein ABZU75_00410 [Streptosporangium sp. NPDC005286]|uniref:hypothetical protein n=1 Tax=Streptosporangium sp. NPDC005286 TaxID=3154463 RepID=UPI0033B10CAB
MPAYTDGEKSWWTSPELSDSGAHALSSAVTLPMAAEQLAAHYAILRARPAASLLDSELLLILELVKGDLSLIDFLPGWVQVLVAPLIPTAIAAVAGYRAEHEPRPDLPMSQR